MTDDTKIAEKLDALISLLTPKPADPKQDSIAKAEAVLRKALEGQFPQEKLDAWDLDHLLIAQDAASVRILPDPLSKADAKPDDMPSEQEAEKTDSLEDQFKYPATDYNKEVPF